MVLYRWLYRDSIGVMGACRRSINPKPYMLRLEDVDSPPQVDRIWLWVYYTRIPIYPIFYQPEGN